MDKATISKIVTILLTAAVALAAVFGYDVGIIQPRETDALILSQIPESRAVGDTNLTNLVLTGDLTVAGDVATSGALTLGRSDITPTAGQTITPQGNYSMYTINSSGAVSITLAAPTQAGQILILYGDDNNTITVNDTNIRSTDGNAVTLGQYDVVLWVSTATEWIHVAKSADS